MSGWKVSNFNSWSLIGKKSPQEPQMFYSMGDTDLTFTKGDVLAARCTMVNPVRYGSSSTFFSIDYFLGEQP